MNESAIINKSKKINLKKYYSNKSSCPSNKDNLNMKKTQSDKKSLPRQYITPLNLMCSNSNKTKKNDLNDLVFNNSLIPKGTFDEGIMNIFYQMIDSMKLIRSTINMSQELSNDNSIKSIKMNKSNTFQEIILSKREKEDLYSEMILHSNKRFNIYEAHINTIMSNLKSIIEIVNQFEILNKNTINSPFQTIDSEIKNNNIFKTLDIANNKKTKKSPYKINNSLFLENDWSSSHISDHIYNNHNLFNKSNNNKDSHISNVLKSHYSTINNNSTTVTAKQTPNKASNTFKSIFSTSSKNNNMNSNYSLFQVHGQSDLNFTIGKKEDLDLKNKLIKTTSRYDESEIEENSRIKQFKRLEYKNNNLQEKNSIAIENLKAKGTLQKKNSDVSSQKKKKTFTQSLPHSNPLFDEVIDDNIM